MKGDFSPLVFATYFGNQEAAEYLIKKGAEINHKDVLGNTVLMGVSFKGLTELAELLISNGADIEAKNNAGETALMFAAKYGQLEMVRLLIGKGADKSAIDSSGLNRCGNSQKKKDIRKFWAYYHERYLRK